MPGPHPYPTVSCGGSVRARTVADAAGSLRERQRAFADAILDPAQPVPQGLVGPDGVPSTRRFAVYRNNVVAGLVGALKDAYPAVRRIVGEEFFTAAARIYVAREPPVSPMMLDYGAGFPDFLGAFEPAATLPYLADVARLERLWVEAYHAAEATPTDPTSLGAVAPERLPGIRLALHPSVRVVRSAFPVASIWQMNVGSGRPHAIDIGGGEDALITRPLAEVEVRVLPIGAAAFVDGLAAGSTVLDAVKAALGEAPGFDLAGAIAGLLTAGAVVGWSAPDAFHEPTGSPT